MPAHTRTIPSHAFLLLTVVLSCLLPQAQPEVLGTQFELNYLEGDHQVTQGWALAWRARPLRQAEQGRAGLPTQQSQAQPQQREQQRGKQQQQQQQRPQEPRQQQEPQVPSEQQAQEQRKPALPQLPDLDPQSAEFVT